MTHHLLCGFVVCASFSSLVAQEPTPAPERALLKDLAGTWKVTATGPTTAAGKARPSEQLETSELICAGSWLESVTCAGKSEMIWWTGFDPAANSFVRLRVAGRAEPVIEDGTFDAEHRTITWQGRSVVAKRLGMQDVVTLRAGEPRVDRTNLVAGGQDKPFLERVFSPAAAGQRATPKSRQPQAPTPDHELLAQLAGDWDCAITATMPGMEKPARSRGRMREQVVGDGCWLHSSFEGELNGSRIEGRGLMGFDSKQKRYVCYWVDNGSPALAISTSALDETGKKLIGAGTTPMPSGEVTIAEEIELDTDLRHLMRHMSTSDGKDAGTFEMVMTRRPATNAK